MRQWLVGLSICLLPLEAIADWQLGPGSEIFVGTPSAFAVTDRGFGALGVQCSNGSPLIWTQGWTPSAAGADRPETFEVSVDGRAHTVSGRHTPPDGLWTGAPSAALIDDLKAGSSAVVITEGAGSVSVSLRGSSRTISRILEGCDVSADAATSPPDDGPVALSDPRIIEACGGGYTLAEGTEMTGLIDDDDEPDIVLDWGGVTCDDRTRGRGAGFCGAALCTIEVLLTETGRSRQILGVNPEIVARAFGAEALKTTTQGRTCGGATQTCDVIWIWTGADLEPRL